MVFSDVDGVLSHPHAHSCNEAARALQRLRREDVPVALCSSHTRAEVEWLQQELGIRHPFVCESGGAAFVPAGYFEFAVPGARDLAGYRAVEFGRPYAEVAGTLHRTAQRLRIEIHGNLALLAAIRKRKRHPPHGCQLCPNEIVAEIEQRLLA